MDSRLPNLPTPDPNGYSNDSGSVPEFEDDEGEFVEDETLMEALSQVISVDPDTGNIEGCANDFRLTRDVLRRHDQEEVADEVLALLRAQGAHCDCEVLLHSKIDLIFLEDDDAELDEEFEGEMAT